MKPTHPPQHRVEQDAVMQEWIGVWESSVSPNSEQVLQDPSQRMRGTKSKITGKVALKYIVNIQMEVMSRFDSQVKSV